jgi:hypothetical protein
MTQEEVMIGTALSAWKLTLSRLDQKIATFSDDYLQREVAPGRNRIFYLLGHLTVVHDRLFPMLDLGEQLHPELEEAFFANPDRAFADPISPAQLRHAWSEVNSKLTAAFETLQPQQWLQKHNAVSAEDFAKDPLRNRLAVLISRTNHASFHLGQILLAKK